MCPIVDGTPVDAATTNAQKLDKVSDDTAVGVIELNNVAVASGSAVTNLQREHNSAASFMGKALNSVKNDLPAWTANNGLVSTDDLFERTDALSAKFDQTTGHGHTGAAGDAPAVDFGDLSGTQLVGYGVQGTNITGATGTSDDVSALLVGETPSTAQNVEGIVVNAPHNYVHIFDTSHDVIFDGSGNKVYGRLTEAAGVWTLSYYSNVAGTETAYSFGVATDLVWYYQQLFTEADRPVYSDLFEVRSDEVAATAPTPGLDDVLAVDNSAGASDINLNGNALLNSELVEFQEIATPANPAANEHKLYFKSDGKMYRLNSVGSELEIGATPSLSSVLSAGNSAGANDIDMNDNSIGKIEYGDFKEVAAPATPASGYVRVYAKADGNMYQKDDAGLETSLAAGGGGGGGNQALYVGYHGTGSASDYWSTTSTTYTDPTQTGTPGLTQRFNDGMGTVTTASSSRPGITLTAPYTGTIKITANVMFQGGQTYAGAKLIETSGPTTLGVYGNYYSTHVGHRNISGFFAVTASSSYTFTVQIFTAQDNAYIGGIVSESIIEWIVEYVK